MEPRITEKSEQLPFLENNCQLFVLVWLIYSKVNTSMFSLHSHLKYWFDEAYIFTASMKTEN